MMNLEQIKQEQERVLRLLEGVTEGQWYAYTHFHGTAIYSPRTPSPQERFEPDEHPIHVIAENAGSVDGALMAESQRLARAYLALLDAHLALHAQLAQAEGRERGLREDALKAIDAAIQCEGDVLDVYQRRVSLTTLDLAVADMKQDSLPKLKAARAALAQAGEG